MINGIISLLEGLGIIIAFTISIMWLINEGYEANKKSNIKKEIGLLILALILFFGARGYLGR